MPPRKKITDLREQLSKKNIDAYIVPSNDEYMGEYVPSSAKRLEWLTGFKGSNGVAIIGKEDAAFFTDGRYVLQAAKQVNKSEYARFNITDTSPYEWAGEVCAGKTIGFDPWLMTDDILHKYAKKGCNLRAVTGNLVDTIWQKKPDVPCGKVVIHEMQFTGKPSSEKRQEVAEIVKENGAGILIVTAPDSICWLLNIRGGDVPCAPLVHATLFLESKGEAVLFINKHKLDGEVVDRLKDAGIVLIDTSELYEGKHAIEMYLEEYKGGSTVFQLDPTLTPYWFVLQLKRLKLACIKKEDPCQLAKACKNETEIAGAQRAHVRDGVAVVRFLHWLDTQIAAGAELDEISVAEKLAEFRKLGEYYQGPSFETISGFGSNGAIVHYRADERSNKKFEQGSLYLVDSGAQYLDGTTDITRTIPVGETTAEHKTNFTRVLKGHLALATVTFPQGTTGSQIDALARQYLWQVGLDYDHGTGHGVGSYLSVHEGPQRVSKVSNAVALKEGMIISNEPGFYKEDEYGIRIENLVTVMERDDLSSPRKKFFGFMPLTLVPIDKRLVDKSLLSTQEIAAFNAYHEYVLEEIKPQFSEEEDKDTIAWLEVACAAL